MTLNQPPEQIARDKIDAQLEAADWHLPQEAHA